MEKRLYKSSDNKVFAGVCGGIGEYFSIDPVIIRLLWVGLTLMAGAGLIAYIVAAFIIPHNPDYIPIERNHARTGDGLDQEGLTTDEMKERERMEARKNTRGALYTLGIALIVLGLIIFLRSYIPWIPEETFLVLLLVGIGVYLVFGKK